MDVATEQRIAQARAEALKLLHADSPDKALSKQQDTSTTTNNKPASSSGFSTTYRQTVCVGDENFRPDNELSPLAGRDNPNPSQPYTPGRIYQSSASDSPSPRANFIYPSYGKIMKATRNSTPPPFKPPGTSLRSVGGGPALSASYLEGGKLWSSFTKVPKSPRRSEKDASQTGMRSSALSFTVEEVATLADQLNTRDGIFHLKRLVSPSLKMIEKVRACHTAENKPQNYVVKQQLSIDASK